MTPHDDTTARPDASATRWPEGVTRRPCPTNRRIQYATLTDAGPSLLEGGAPGHVAEVRRPVFDRLTHDDVPRLRSLALRLLAGLDG